MFGEESGDPSFNWDSRRFEKSLAFNWGVASCIAKHLVQDAFMRDMLINDEQIVSVLGEDKCLVNLTENAQSVEQVGQGLGISV